MHGKAAGGLFSTTIPLLPALSMLIRKPKVIAIAAVAALIVVLASGGLYHEHQKRVKHDRGIAWVLDAAAHLRAVLSAESGKPGTADELDVLKVLDTRFEAVAKHHAALREQAGVLPESTANAVEHYLIGAREILRLYAASRRHRHFTAVGLRELWEHMGSRYSQGPGWTTEAVRRKDLLEREYFQYRNTTEALLRLLDGYPEDRARAAPLLDARSLPDERMISAARERLLEDAKKLAVEMDRLRKLPRG
jgi:hypothetical protein